MKLFQFQFYCPSCKTRLQSEPSASGTASHCPVCKYGITVPAAPPRPIGGWLELVTWSYVSIFCGYMVTVIGLSVFADNFLFGIWLAFTAAVIYSPSLIVPGIGAWAMWKKKRWFRWYFPASCWLIPVLILAAILFSGKSEFFLLFVIFSVVPIAWTLYFMKSQRVKETFIL